MSKKEVAKVALEARGSAHYSGRKKTLFVYGGTSTELAVLRHTMGHVLPFKIVFK